MMKKDVLSLPKERKDRKLPKKTYTLLGEEQ